MTHTKLTLTALALSLSACGVEPDLAGYAPAPSKLIYDHTTDGVEGSLQQNGVELKFHLVRLSPEAMEIILGSQDGFVLVDSRIGKVLEASTVLGEYEVTGARLPKDVLADLAAMPELQLLPALERDLANDGIDVTQLRQLRAAIGEIACPTAQPQDDFASSNKEITRK